MGRREGEREEEGEEEEGEREGKEGRQRRKVCRRKDSRSIGEKESVGL